MEKIATDLAPTFIELLKKVEAWIRTHPEEIKSGITAVGTALTALVTGMVDLTRQLAPAALAFTHIAEAMTGKEGAAAAFELLGKIIETAVIVRLLRMLGLLGRLGNFRLLGILGLGTLAATANAEGILTAGEGSKSWHERLLRTIDPGLADRVYGQTDADKQADAKSRGAGTLLRRGWNHVKRAFGGGDEAPKDQSGGRVQGGAGNAEGARESYTFWRGKGLTHEQAAGLVGMEEGESQFNPRARGDYEHGAYQAHGAFQHRANRRAQILKGTGIDIDNATHLQQLEAAHWEMTQGPDVQARRAWRRIKLATTPGESASAGVYDFERPRDKPGEAAKRGARANYWAGRLKGSPVVQPPARIEDVQSIPTPAIPPPTSTTVLPPAVPRLPPLNFTPGGFDVNKLTAPPMTTSQNDNSRSVVVNQNHTTKVDVHGAKDPAATGQQVERAIDRTQETGLRNAQTAIR